MRLCKHIKSALFRKCSPAVIRSVILYLFCQGNLIFIGEKLGKFERGISDSPDGPYSEHLFCVQPAGMIM